MKIKKHFLTIIICFVVAFCMIGQTGCDTDDAVKPIEIRFWHTYTGKQCDIFEMLVNTYNATEGKSRNVFVVTEFKTQKEITDYLNNAFSSKASNVEFPEITFITKETAYKAKMHNLIVNAEKYLSKEELEGYFTGFMQEGKITGTEETFVFPISKTSEVTIINDSLWKQFCVDESAQLEDWQTWDGITSLAEKYYKWSGGRALMAFESVEDFIFTYSAQKLPSLIQTANKEIKINTNKETLRSIWNFYYGGVVNGYILQTDDIVGALEQGDIMAYTGVPHDMTFFPETYKNFNKKTSVFSINSVLYPSVDASKKVYNQKGSGVSVFNHGDKVNQASYNFLHWFCASENAIQFSAANNEISSYQPIYEKTSTKDYFNQLSVFNYNKYQLLSTSLSQVTEGETYSPTGFIGYESFCDEITDSLVTSAKKALGAVIKSEKEGYSRKEAVSLLWTDVAFEDWYSNVVEMAKKY